MPNAAPLLERHAIELLRFAAGHAQGFPFARAQVFSQKDDLAKMKGVVGERAVESLDYSMRFLPDVDGAHEVVRLERIEGRENHCPAFFPPTHEVVARRVGGDLEFVIAMAGRFFAVRGEEVGEARTHIAGDVLDENRDRVRFGVEHDEEVVVFQLSEGAFGQALVSAHQPAYFVKEMGRSGVHVKHHNVSCNGS